jgi:hypothetical protein
MTERTEHAAITGTNKAWNRERRINRRNVLEGCGLALRNGHTFSWLTKLEDKATAFTMANPVIEIPLTLHRGQVAGDAIEGFSESPNHGLRNVRRAKFI